MNSRQFNGIYRPMIKQLWLKHCARRGLPPNDKAAYNLWYQSFLMDITGGKLASTKGASPKMQTQLIDRLKAILGDDDSLPIEGRWTDAQITRFKELAQAAYNAARLSRQVPDFPAWAESICARNGYPATDTGALYFPDVKVSFDKVMGDLAVIANDDYWIGRTSAAAENRMRWQIGEFLKDLDFLDKRFHHEWSYVRSIYKQADLLPLDIEDCPVATLQKVLQMLDTHIRRLCADFNIRPMDLPGRSHPHAHPTINEHAKHLHIGHALEHIPAPIHVTEEEAVPF